MGASDDGDRVGRRRVGGRMTGARTIGAGEDMSNGEDR